MQGSTYIVALAASGLAAAFVAAPHPAAAKAPKPKLAAHSRRVTAARPANTAPPRSLAQMNLTPRDVLQRPYASTYHASDDWTPLAVDYRFAADGVMSFGLHRGSGVPADPRGVDQSFAVPSPTTHSSVGALVTYNFR